jgi:long-chain acyl-CoA synthetase
MEQRTIIRLRDQAAIKFGEKPYLRDKNDQGWGAVSFRQAADVSDRLAAALTARGFSREDRAVIIAEGRSEWVLSELALFRAGCVSVPLSLKLLPEEIPFRVNHSGSRAIFFSHITWEKVLAVKGKYETEMLFVCMDDKPELLDKIAAAGSLKKGENLVSFAMLLAEGDKAAAAQAGELAKRLEAMSENDTVNICYTSGTTGNPKGIMLTHLNYWANVEGACATVNIPIGWRTLVILPIDHSFAHTVALFTAFVRCITLFFVDARGGASTIVRNIPANLVETNPHFLLTVPALTGNFMKKMKSGVAAKGEGINRLFLGGLNAGIRRYGNGLDKPGFGIRFKTFFPWAVANLLVFPKLRKIFGKNLKFCIGGGALLDVKQQEFFNAIGVPVYQGYGLTEAAPIISANGPKRHKFGTSGNILPNIELMVVDDNRKELPRGVRGELVIRAESVMKGYFKNPEATAKALDGGWLYTGDLGYVEESGLLMVVGREKALLIAGDGEKYSPEEIEEAIVNCTDWIEQVMLWCDHKNYTTALIVPARDKLKSAGIPEQVLQKLGNELSAFKNDPAFRDKFPTQWTPAVYQVVSEPFTEANQMINSTMKMVRYRITEAYRDKIEYMYTDEGKSIVNPKNLAAVKDLIG